MADFKTIFGEILEIIEYKGNKQTHMEDLQKALEAKVVQATHDTVNDFFIDYIQAVGPTLNDQQRVSLAKYFELMQAESSDQEK